LEVFRDVTLLLGEQVICRVKQSKKTDWPWMEAQQLHEVTASCWTAQHHIAEDLKLQFVSVQEIEPNLCPACCSVTVPTEVPGFPLILSVYVFT
jgi:hypothetical protein